MTKDERAHETAHLKNEACSPKSRLIEIASRLEELGNKKEADRLHRIIWRLEVWQNT